MAWTVIERDNTQLLRKFVAMENSNDSSCSAVTVERLSKVQNDGGILLMDDEHPGGCVSFGMIQNPHTLVWRLAYSAIDDGVEPVGAITSILSEARRWMRENSVSCLYVGVLASHDKSDIDVMTDSARGIWEDLGGSHESVRENEAVKRFILHYGDVPEVGSDPGLDLLRDSA